jgi:hypothetical protein
MFAARFQGRPFGLLRRHVRRCPEHRAGRRFKVSLRGCAFGAAVIDDLGEPKVEYLYRVVPGNQHVSRLEIPMPPNADDEGARGKVWLVDAPRLGIWIQLESHDLTARVSIGLGSARYQCTWRIIRRVGTHPGPRNNESGRDEIYIQAFPLSGGVWQVSNNEGSEPGGDATARSCSS